MYTVLIAFVRPVTAAALFSSLSLHDALPIFADGFATSAPFAGVKLAAGLAAVALLAAFAGAGPRAEPPPPAPATLPRSEEHTSELQSLRHLVCRLLLEKKKKHLSEHNTNGSN